MHCHKNVIPITKSKIYIYISLFCKTIKLTIYKFKTKTRIYKNTNNFIFLGHDKNGRYSKYRKVKRDIRKKIYLYNNKKSSIIWMLIKERK